MSRMTYLKAFAALLRDDDFVVLDTETTGLDSAAEIVEIAVLDRDGNVLIDQIVKPTLPIPSAASNVHGILDHITEGAPSWRDIQKRVLNAIEDKHVVIWNSEFDVRLMNQSSKAWAFPFNWNQAATYHCAMRAYSERYGEWSEYYQNFKYQKLTSAARRFGIPIANAHRAAGDCAMTLAVVNRLIEEARA